MADDYDSFKLRIPDTIILNTVFWATQNNFETFMDLYEDGFNGFTEQQLALYRIKQQELEKVVQALEFFDNDEVTFNGKDYHFIATFADKYIDEVGDYILKTYEADVALVINKKTKHVSFRRFETSDINLGDFAEKMANGGGHPFAAGGELLTREMLSFTQSLKPRKKLKRRRDTE